MNTHSESRTWHQARAAGEHTFDFDVVGWTWQGSAWHGGCLVDAMVAMGELAPAARSMEIGDVFSQYGAANGGELEVPAGVTRSEASSDAFMICDRCATSLVEVDDEGDRYIVARDAASASAEDAAEDARAIAAGWISPDAPGLTAFATGHAGAPALLEDAIDEIGALITRSGAFGTTRELEGLRDHLTAQLPYFVLTSSLPGYLPEGEPYVARGVRAMRETMGEMLHHAAHGAAERVPSSVLAFYDSHDVEVATDYATHVLTLTADDGYWEVADVLERLAELDELDIAVGTLADTFTTAGGEVCAATYVYAADRHTRAELETMGWSFTADGEVDYDALPY